MFKTKKVSMHWHYYLLCIISLLLYILKEKLKSIYNSTNAKENYHYDSKINLDL